MHITKVGGYDTSKQLEEPLEEVNLDYLVALETKWTHVRDHQTREVALHQTDQGEAGAHIGLQHRKGAQRA